MEQFQQFNFTNFSIFSQKVQFFQFFLHLFKYSEFLDPGSVIPPDGFDNKLLPNVYWLWNSFSLFNIKF